MDTISRDNTLLTVLLVLRNLEDPSILSQRERAELYEVGEQLELDPDDWEFICEGLMATISSNLSINQLFEVTKTQLDAVNIKLLLPTEEELAAALETGVKIERRGSSDPGEDSRPEIVKISTNFLKDSNPFTKTKQSTWLARVVNTLNSNHN